MSTGNSIFGQEVLRVNDVASILGVHRTSVFRWIKSGRLPAPFKTSTKFVFWRKREFMDWFENQFGSAQNA